MIGLDIQTHAIRAVKLKRKQHTLLLEWLHTSILTEKLVEKTNYWQLVENALRDLLASEKDKTVAIAIPGNLARLQTISLPLGLSDDEIKKEIQIQIQQDFPEMNEALAIDFVSVAKKEIGYMDIFFVATKQAVLNQYLACIEAVGGVVKIVDVDMFAIKRAINLLLPYLQQTPHLILHVTERVVLFAIHEEKIFSFHCWALTDENDFFTQLYHYIQLYLNSNPSAVNTHLVIATKHNYVNNILPRATMLQQFTLHWPILSSQYVSHIDQIALSATQSSDYLLALGLAMRVTPTW